MLHGVTLSAKMVGFLKACHTDCSIRVLSLLNDIMSLLTGYVY